MTCARCATLIRERDEAREQGVILLDTLRVARVALIVGVLDDTNVTETLKIIDAALTATRRG